MKGYLKFLSRNKLYTAIEAVGLIVSLAFVLLIGAYVRHQWRTAHGAPEWKHYYAIGTADYEMVDFTATGTANLLKENMPGVDKATMFCYRHIEPSLDDERIGETGMATVEPDYFEMFPLEWVEGDMSSLLGGGVAISESLARQHSQGRDIVGRSIVSWGDTISIAAIFRTPAAALFQEADFLRVREWKEVSRGASGGDVCLISSAMPEDELIASIDRVFEEHNRRSWGRDESRAFKNGCIERMDRLYFSELNGGMAFHQGNLSLLRMLSAVVLLLLLSAVFNYINLSAALAGKRTKEMGMRSILGASRWQVVCKYLAESLAFTLICAGIAILVARTFAPALSHFVETRDGERFVSAPFSWHFDATTAALFFGVTLLAGLLAGWIPARMASRYNPVQVVKGDYRIRSKQIFSKVFIVFQTALSVLLIAFALVMEHQYSHMIHQPLGADVEDLYVQYMISDAQWDAVQQLPFVKESGLADGYPGKRYMTVSGPMDDGNMFKFTTIRMSPEAFRICGYEVLEDFHTPSGTGVWLSESAWNSMGMEEGQDVLPDWAGFFGTKQVAGILKDFAVTDAAHIQPDDYGVIEVTDKQQGSYMLLRIEGNRKEAEKRLEALFQEYNVDKPGYMPSPNLNGFVRDKVNDGLEEAENYMRLIELFTALAVLISLLGLLAMSALFASERTHDIAVRKVFGSTVREETLKAVGEYMILVCMSCVIAVPVAAWLARRYLEGFNYRISAYGWIFAVAVLLSLAISFASVLWQDLKAARTDPAVELKKE
jgi:putative ABC transport system permease protein